MKVWTRVYDNATHRWAEVVRIEADGTVTLRGYGTTWLTSVQDVGSCG